MDSNYLESSHPLKKRKESPYLPPVPVRYAGKGFELTLKGGAADPVEIGGALRRLREDAGIGIGDMAERVGMARQNLSRLELGKREATLTSLNRILRTLGLELVIVARTKPTLKPRAEAEKGEDAP